MPEDKEPVLLEIEEFVFLDKDAFQGLEVKKRTVVLAVVALVAELAFQTVQD